MPKHVHAEIIKAWADGAEIEVKRNTSGQWSLNNYPSWHPDFKYRIKPEPKPDVMGYARVGMDVAPFITKVKAQYHNVKYTFDGETGELKAVELI